MTEDRLKKADLLLFSTASTARYAHLFDHFLLQVADEVSREIAKWSELPDVWAMAA